LMNGSAMESGLQAAHFGLTQALKMCLSPVHDIFDGSAGAVVLSSVSL
jgi:hypothetical protein